MRNKAKVIIFIPLFLGILLVLGKFTLVGAGNQVTRFTNAQITNSMDGKLYLPIIENKACSVLPIESPFSIEIAALHQISPINLIDQEISDEQFYAWYNQAYPTLLSALKDSGAGWTRIVIRWFDIEPNEPVQGVPTYSQSGLQWYDDRINQITQTGVKIIAVVNSAPAWANNSLSCPAITSDHLQEYQQFLTDLVTRYSQPPYNIKTWEIFNESDNTTLARAESHTCFGNYSSLYAQVLSNSYQTIKSVDPNATVLMSGIAYEWWTEAPYNGPFYRYFPDDVVAAGGASFFDALNFHYFPDYHAEWERWNPPAQPPTCSRPPEQPGLAYDSSGIDVIAKNKYFTNRMSTCYSVNKPVWLTETGEHGVITDAGSLNNQAYYVIKGYSRGLAAGIKNITWFTLAQPELSDNQSLLFADLSPKPAFNTYKTLVSQLTNYKYDRTLLSNPNTEAYVFRNSCNDEKIVAWGNNIPINISPANSLEVTDYLGNVSTIQDGGLGDADGSINGSIQVRLLIDPMSGSTVVPGPVPIPVFIHVTTP